MTARVTQQLLLTAYSTSPQGRVTAVVFEVLRPNTTISAGGAKPQVIVVAS